MSIRAKIINGNLLKEVQMTNEMNQLLEYFEKSTADIWEPSNSEALNHIDEIKNFFEIYIDRNNTQFSGAEKGHIDENVQYRLLEILNLMSRKLMVAPSEESFIKMRMVDEDFLTAIRIKSDEIRKIGERLENESTRTQILIEKYMR